MTKIFKQNSLKDIEWTFVVPSLYDVTIASESFLLLNDHTCHLEFRNKSNGYADLYFRCNKTLHSFIPVKVHITFPFVTYTETANCTNYSHRNAICSFRVRGYSVNILSASVTIKASFEHSTSKDDQSTQTPSYIDTRFLLEGVSKDYSKLLEDGRNHDVEFICEDGHIPAHKNVLSCRSKVFESMLQSDMVEGETGRINIEDMDLATCQQFLKVLHTGMLPKLTVDNTVEFYKAGDKYAIDMLKELCAEFLLDNLSRDNACGILIMADQHNDPVLKKGVMEYIFKEKIPTVGEKWTDFCNENKDLALKVLNFLCKHLLPE